MIYLASHGDLPTVWPGCEGAHLPQGLVHTYPARLNMDFTVRQIQSSFMAMLTVTDKTNIRN